MILEGLHLKNFKRYRDEKFFFKDGITAIIGSNGAGKSSIMEGIVFALYGISGSGIDPDFVVSAGAGPKESCEVRLNFSTGGERYSVLRTFRKTKSTSHDASLHFGDGRLIAQGVSPVRDALLGIIRMGPSDFRTTIYAPQKDLLALLDKNPVERKRWFMRALGIERIRDGAWEQIRSEIRELEGTIAMLSGRLEEIDPDRLKAEDQEEKVREEEQTAHLTTLSRQEEEITSHEAEHAKKSEDLQQKMMIRAELGSKHGHKQERLNELTTAITRAEAECAALEEEMAEYAICAEKELLYPEIRDRAGQLRKTRDAHQEAALRLREAERRLHDLQEVRSRLAERRDLIRKAEETMSSLRDIPAQREQLLADRRHMEAAREIYHISRQESATIEAEIRILGERGQALRREREGLHERLKALETIEEDLTSYEGILEEKNRYAERERLSAERERIKKEIDLIEADIREFTLAAEPLAAEVLKREEAYGAITAARENADQIRRRIATIHAELSRGREVQGEAERHLHELEAAGEKSLCPTCGQPLRESYDEARTRLLDQIRAARADEECLTLECASHNEQLKLEDDEIRRGEERIRQSHDAERRLAGFEAKIGERKREHERAATQYADLQEKITHLTADGIDADDLERRLEEYTRLIRERDAARYEILRLPKIEAEQQALTGRAEALFGRLEEAQSKAASSGYSEEGLATIDREITAIEPLYEEYRTQAAIITGKESAEEELGRVESERELLIRRTASIRDEIEQIGFDPDAYTRGEEAYKEAVTFHDRYLSLKGRVERIPEVKAGLDALKTEKRGYAADILRLEEELALLAHLPSEVERTRREGEVLRTRRKQSDTEIRTCTVLLAEVRQKRGRIRESIAKAGELARLQKETLSEKALLESTGTILKQFAEHLIGSVRGRIEGEVGAILSLITDGRYEHVTIDDDFSIRVHEAGVDYPSSRFSGGEQDDIAVALRIALSRHIAATHRIRDATVLIFDEIFGSQDDERRKHLIRALRRQEAHFPQILLISHIEGVQEECQTTIRVEERPDLTSIATEVGE
ncbi:hypothetical protein RJ53_10650 [Methanocalculus chunghsingensis]|uniref:Rad50/SbcC-type AAA domain-containing protein n=1 Tax=Methanocalculus chunghsingensis TaxID=156457 RepID=A0A8J8B4Z4_9EURY|nr:SMC family ATPase [Methanocalculus chunghsingensis]MBR1369910.1 hypothetical protein [Methanocalculus chunghsingensis]